MQPGFFLTPDTWNLSMVYSTTDRNITLIHDEPQKPAPICGNLRPHKPPQ